MVCDTPSLSGMHKGGGASLITIKDYSSQLLFQTLTIKVEIPLLLHSEHSRLRIHTVSKKKLGTGLLIIITDYLVNP